MTLKIEGRVVIIAGPKSTGKLGVAKRLIDENPLGRGIIVPYCGRMSQSNAEKHSKYEREKEKVIVQAIKNGLFTVIVCEDVSSDKIKSMITTCQLKGYFRKVQVLKFNLSEELHSKFLRKGHKEFTNETMIEDRARFQQIVDTDYTDINVIQSLVKNPSNIKLEFVF